MDQSLTTIKKNLTEIQKLLILVIGSKNYQPMLSNMRLQKTIFLFLRRIAKNQEEKEKFFEFFGFYPHKRGPYSELIDEELSQLRYNNLVKIENKKIELTKFGKIIFNNLIKSIPEDYKKILEDTKEFINDSEVSDIEILTYIYDLERDYAEKSEVNDLINRNRLKCAISLYKKGKISIGRAAELAGVSVSEFKEIINKRIED